MALIEWLSLYPGLFSAGSALLGLMVGSFLNVVVHRLPRMMQSQWRRECREYLDLPPESSEAPPRYNLWVPRSHCPACGSQVRALHNIPLLSYCLLQGHCADCRAPISKRYPLTELLCSVLSATVAWHYGYGETALYALLCTWALLCLALIDLDHQLLPDSIVLPLLWLGLLLSLKPVYVDSQQAIVGAAAGYLVLWTIFHLFRLATGKEGMGHGDFKLLAALGAWTGWQMLPLIILLSSLVGAVAGIGMILLGRRDRSAPIPFGPFLAAAGWIALLWGQPLVAAYLG